MRKKLRAILRALEGKRKRAFYRVYYREHYNKNIKSKLSNI